MKKKLLLSGLFSVGTFIIPSIYLPINLASHNQTNKNSGNNYLTRSSDKYDYEWLNSKAVDFDVLKDNPLIKWSLNTNMDRSGSEFTQMVANLRNHFNSNMYLSDILFQNIDVYYKGDLGNDSYFSVKGADSDIKATTWIYKIRNSSSLISMTKAEITEIIITNLIDYKTETKKFNTEEKYTQSNLDLMSSPTISFNSAWNTTNSEKIDIRAAMHWSGETLLHLLESSHPGIMIDASYQKNLNLIFGFSRTITGPTDAVNFHMTDFMGLSGWISGVKEFELDLNLLAKNGWDLVSSFSGEFEISASSWALGGETTTGHIDEMYVHYPNASDKPSYSAFYFI